MLISVLYSCRACGLKDRSVIVPERDPAEDVVHYVQSVVGECVGADHANISPRCTATHLTELKIPVDPENPNAPIGAKVPPKPL
jgi:hypothetical protein